MITNAPLNSGVDYSYLCREELQNMLVALFYRYTVRGFAFVVPDERVGPVLK
jgi:hypothetical protein